MKIYLSALTLVVALFSVSVARTPLSIKSADYSATIANDFRGSGLFVFTVVVTNTTQNAVDEAIFYIRSKDPNRTVPDAETVQAVEIPGGIEPSETRTVSVTISSRLIGARNEVYAPKNPVEIAVVDRYPDRSVKPYVAFKSVKMKAAKYRDRRDPALQELFGQ